MIKKFLIYLLVFSVLGLGNICFKSFSGHNSMGMPKAEAMMVATNCNNSCGQIELNNSNINCCLTSHFYQKLLNIASTKLKTSNDLTPSVIAYVFRAYANDIQFTNQKFNFVNSQHRPSPTLTGILVKKE